MQLILIALIQVEHKELEEVVLVKWNRQFIDLVTLCTAQPSSPVLPPSLLLLWATTNSPCNRISVLQREREGKAHLVHTAQFMFLCNTRVGKKLCIANSPWDAYLPQTQVELCKLVRLPVLELLLPPDHLILSPPREL